MKNYIYLLIFCLIAQMGLHAQSDEALLVHSVSGKVKYQAPGAKKAINLKPATIISPEGSIQVSKNGQVGLLFDKQYGWLENAGTQTGQQIIENVDLFRENDLGNIFNTKVEEAINPFFASVQLNRSGFAAIETGSTSSTSESTKPPKKPRRDGQSNKDFKLVPLQPFGGKVGAGTIQFQWRLQAGANAVKNFTLQIMDRKNQVLLERTVKGSEFNLSPSELRLETGMSYRWQVKSTADPSISSAVVTFSCVPLSQQQKLMSSLKGNPLYEKAQPNTRLILEAIKLENEGWEYSATKKYQQAIRMDKKNALAKALYKAYLWRNDLFE